MHFKWEQIVLESMEVLMKDLQIHSSSVYSLATAAGFGPYAICYSGSSLLCQYLYLQISQSSIVSCV